MQTCYFITSTGVKHAIANSDKNNKDENSHLLLFFLKQTIHKPVLFSDILLYLNNEKTRTFKEISKMISLNLIDMNEVDDNKAIQKKSNTVFFLDEQCSDSDYIISDLNGFPISSCGFNRQQSINISAVAYDYIKASKRSRYEIDTVSLDTPLSIKTRWNDLDIIIYLLYFEKFSCLLITKETDFLNQVTFINLASYLCNRYNYEQ